MIEKNQIVELGDITAFRWQCPSCETAFEWNLERTEGNFISQKKGKCVVCESDPAKDDKANYAHDNSAPMVVRSMTDTEVSELRTKITNFRIQLKILAAETSLQFVVRSSSE